MRTIVIYRSATGFTRKYAVWIAEALAADLFELKQVTPQMVQAYDCIIFGGRLYAVGIDGVKFITRNFETFKNSRLIVFATGASVPGEAVAAEVFSQNFTPQQQASIDFYYLRGGFDYMALPPFDRLLMYLLKKKISWKKARGKKLDPDEAGMLTLYNRVADFTSQEHIAPILEAARADGE